MSEVIESSVNAKEIKIVKDQANVDMAHTQQ